MAELSILIPARNEMFLKKTIEDMLRNIEGDTEIIAVLDGAWADPGIQDNDRVSIIYNPESIGQRAATNQAARLSKAKYVMKCDAHCAFDKGFDVKMMREMHDDWTMVPLMRNLHAFDWVCPAGHRRYQGPSGPCQKCGAETVRDVVWIAKPRPESVSYCFDSTPHFQYFREYSKRPEGRGEITETMSLQGSCWMLTRDKYWELNVCDEKFGSWGSQGIEVACKTWLSGGAVMVNKKTWYAHMFRTQGGDFGFPYPISAKDQEKAKEYAKDLFFNNKWDKQIHPLWWLVERFWPVKGWTDEDLIRLKSNTFTFSGQETHVKTEEVEPTDDISTEVMDTNGQSLPTGSSVSPTPKSHPNLFGVVYPRRPQKGIIFYTDNQLKLKIAREVQKQLKSISRDLGIPIVSASLKPMPHFGDKNVFFPHLKRGYLTMFKQILGALQNSSAEIIFFCEHDCLYSHSHFDFTPPTKDKFYYNQNFWKLRLEDGHALHYDANQLSGMCCYRELAIAEYRKRVERVEKEGYDRNMGFEPGTHDKNFGTWKSAKPIIDIRHNSNLTRNRWSQDEFRNKQNCAGWMETDDYIPGWGKTTDLTAKLI